MRDDIISYDNLIENRFISEKKALNFQSDIYNSIIISDSSILVEKDVIDSMIISNHNIKIKGNIYGKKTYIKALNNVEFNKSFSGSIFAGNEILINDASYYTELKALNNIYAIRGKKEIYGGVIVAGKKIVADYIGSIECIPTRLELSKDMIINKLKIEKINIKKTINNLKEKIDDIKIEDDFLMELKNYNIYSEKLVKTIDKDYLYFEDEYIKYENMLKTIEEELKTNNYKDRHITVKKILFKGVDIFIDNERITVEEVNKPYIIIV